MLVKDLMTSTNLVTVLASTNVGEVADILHNHRFNGVPVLSEDGTVLGLISERELFSGDSKLYLPGYLKILQDTEFIIGGKKELPYAAEQLTRTEAKDIMNQSVYYASPDMTIEELAEIFAKINQNPIPVVDTSNKLLGIIARSDLIKLLIPTSIATHTEHYHTPNIQPKPRPIDANLSYIHKDLSSRFAYVAKARANVWLVATIILFMIGFVVGIIYVADPEILIHRGAVETIPTIPYQPAP